MASDRLADRFTEILEPKAHRCRNGRIARRVSTVPELRREHTNFTFRGVAASFMVDTYAVMLRLTSACPQTIKVLLPDGSERLLDSSHPVVEVSLSPPNRRRSVRFYNRDGGAAAVLIDQEIFE